MAVELMLFSRPGCHLCEEFAQQLMGLQNRYDFVFHVVDITGHDELMEQYGWIIPVLACGDEEICHVRLNESALAQAVERRARG